MARTKASVGAKVSSGKSSKARCSAAPPPTSTLSSGSSDRANHTSGGGGPGNPVCPRPTPKWQRSITNFFISKEVQETDADDGVGTSTSKPKKRNVIESDDEEVQEVTPELEKTKEQPRNSVLDESIELAPLRGENSHKIEEYYTKNGEIQQNGVNQSDDEENQPENRENLPENEENLPKKGADLPKNGEDLSENGQDSPKNGEDLLENGEDLPKNGEDLPKNGEDLPKNGIKGKGKGKKTNKENISTNMNKDTEKRKSVKRDLEDVNEDDHVSKRIKVD